MGAMSFSRDLSSFLFRRSLVVLVVSAVVLSGCSGGGDEPAELSKTVEVPADADGGDSGADGDAAAEVAPIPFDEFDPSAYEVGDVVPEVEIVKPVEYPEMKNFDEAGAEAAAQYMIDVLNYTYNTGDFTYLDAVANDDCDLCDEAKEFFSDVREKGGIITGPVMLSEEINSYGQLNSAWVVDARIDYLKSSVVDGERRVVGNIPGEGVLDQQILVVASENDGWKFSALSGVAFE